MWVFRKSVSLQVFKHRGIETYSPRMINKKAQGYKNKHLGQGCMLYVLRHTVEKCRFSLPIFNKFVITIWKSFSICIGLMQPISFISVIVYHKNCWQASIMPRNTHLIRCKTSWYYVDVERPTLSVNAALFIVAMLNVSIISRCKNGFESFTTLWNYIICDFCVF